MRERRAILSVRAIARKCSAEDAYYKKIKYVPFCRGSYRHLESCKTERF